MINLAITTDPADGMPPRLRQLLADLAGDGSRGLGMVMGRALANTLKKHFRQRNTIPNKLGGSRTNFWSRVADSVNQPEWQPGQVSVGIAHPAIAQKVYGGTIRPSPEKGKKWLAIPVAAAAHGRMARDMSGLEFTLGRDNMVFEGPKPTRKAPGPTAFLGRSEGEKFLVMYVLKKSVTQAADPNALPPTLVMLEAVTKAGGIYLDRPPTGTL